MSAWSNAFLHACASEVCVCVCVCMCVFVYIHTRAHTHTCMACWKRLSIRALKGGATAERKSRPSRPRYAPQYITCVEEDTCMSYEEDMCMRGGRPQVRHADLFQHTGDLAALVDLVEV